MHFKLLYLILQKALGKSRESHLNTRCRQPANRITELCAPITGTHPQSRDPFTPADPVLPTHTRRAPISRSLAAPPIPDPRACSDGAQAASADPEAASRGHGAAPPRGDSRGAGQGGLQVHGAPTAPRPPWGPGPVSSPCGWWQTPRSWGPSEARTPLGWRSRGPLAFGQAGVCGEGLGIELHLLLSVLLPGPGHLALGTDPGSTFPSLSKGPGSSGFSTPPPLHLPPLTPVHSLEMGLYLATSFYPQHPWPGYYCLFFIYCNCFTWDKFFFKWIARFLI